MRQAAVLQDRLVDAAGETVGVGGGQAHVFPHPEALRHLDTVPGVPAAKLARLHGVAEAGLRGVLDAARLRDLGMEAAVESLRTIPGIGPFWASAIYLRALGVADVFPDEPVSIAALGRLHGLGDRPAAADIARLTDLYRPWRMWACYLLRVAAGRADLIPGVRGREMSIRRGGR